MRNIVVESIAFQSFAFAEELTQHFEELIQLGANGKEAQKHPATAAIVKAVKNRTGVNMKLILDTDNPPCVVVPVFKPDHQFIDPLFRGFVVDDYDKILKSAEKNKTDGMLDLENARIGGVFTQIESPIYMGWIHMKALKLSAKEMAAALVHEIGHIFTWYEYLSRAITTNQVLAAIHKSLLANTTDSEHKVVLQRAGKVIGNEHAFDEITDVKDQKVVTTVVLKKGLSDSRSELGTGNYDHSASEQLADQFAARLGLGRELVTALDKIHKAYAIPESSAGARAFSYVAEAILIGITGVGMVVGAMTGSILVAGLAGYLFFGLSWAIGDGNRDFTYDDVRIRFQRVREQYITYLKDRKITDVQAKDAIDQIKKIEEVIAQVKDYNGLFRAIGNFLYPGNRAAKKAIELQRDLEELAANDIFLRAKELTLLK